jgi:hypothetical protein
MAANPDTQIDRTGGGGHEIVVDFDANYNFYFHLQILHGNTSCQPTTHFGEWNFTDSAYCAAPRRLRLISRHSGRRRLTRTHGPRGIKRHREECAH